MRSMVASLRPLVIPVFCVDDHASEVATRPWALRCAASASRKELPAA